uniref:Uncharacterized protein n=1 Tax=Physcomitrium patens TaxID=3218 RepID=A0A7I4AT36_PHYPA|nr:uncharacterized protein LOC112291790 isoform X2 [Physcomitrium patens]|eukprot:XP_024395451.1 uncharacterized protein LOC112291790 isoform X2 [Physcomitrella patens]
MDTIAKAQAVMTAWDSSMSQAWREEERSWHLYLTDGHELDVAYFKSESSHLLDMSDLRYRKIQWREEDMEQRNLENARALWLRFVEKNRRDVEEKSDQLKSISNLAALFCGFATVNLTQFNVRTDYNWVLLGFYGVLTALVEGLMVISMVTCTLILGSIVKMGKLYVNEVAEEEFIFQCRSFCMNFELGDRPPCPKRTLEAFWELRCEKSWQRAFLCFSFGMLSSAVFDCSFFSIQFVDLGALFTLNNKRHI